MICEERVLANSNLMTRTKDVFEFLLVKCLDAACFINILLDLFVESATDAVNIKFSVQHSKCLKASYIYNIMYCNMWRKSF